MKSQVLVEAMAVGAITAVVMTVHAAMFEKPSFVTYFMAGALIHLGFELAGGNSWYCVHGAACRV